MPDESNDQPEVHEFLGKQWREIDHAEFYGDTDVMLHFYDENNEERFFRAITLPAEPGWYMDADGEVWKHDPTRGHPNGNWINWGSRQSLPDWGTPNAVGLRRMEAVS